MTSYWQTRPFLEANIRRRLKTDTDVRTRQNCAVTRLIANEDRTQITGLEIRCGENGETETLEADRIVDASGRGSQTPKWIESLGYSRPEEESVEVNIGYASRMYEPKQDASRDWKIMAQYGTPPESTRTGYIFPIEGGRWMVSAVGFLRDHAPTDEEGYLAFAKSMDELARAKRFEVDSHSQAATNEPGNLLGSAFRPALFALHPAASTARQ